MPNHVANIIIMDDILNRPLFSLQENSGQVYFDFEKIIPMPESLNINDYGTIIEDVAIETVLNKLNTNQANIFNIIKNETTNSNYGKMDIDEYNKIRSTICKNMTDEDLLDYGLQIITNKIKYGCSNWYDWRCENWGTKWNSYDNYINNNDSDRIKFNTAWSAPHAILKKLAQLYPRSIIQHWWADEFFGNANSGYMVYKNGQILGGYDIPGSYDSYIHSNFCWNYSDSYFEHSNVIYLIGDGNVIYKRFFNNKITNVLFYIQEDQSYQEYLQFKNTYGYSF